MWCDSICLLYVYIWWNRYVFTICMYMMKQICVYYNMYLMKQICVYYMYVHDETDMCLLYACTWWNAYVFIICVYMMKQMCLLYVYMGCIRLYMFIVYVQMYMSRYCEKNLLSNRCAQWTQIYLHIRAVLSKYSLSVLGILDPWLFKECSAKILIRLRGCAGWSESSLGARVR